LAFPLAEVAVSSRKLQYPNALGSQIPSRIYIALLKVNMAALIPADG